MKGRPGMVTVDEIGAALYVAASDPSSGTYFAQLADRDGQIAFSREFIADFSHDELVVWKR